MSKKEEIKEETKKEIAVNAEGEEKMPELKENVIYLGPSIPNLISASTVYKDGILPESVNEKISELPMFANFFASIGKMVETVKEINREGSPLQLMYEKVKTETEKKED